MRQFEGLKNMPGRCRWPSSWSSWYRFQWKSWWACLCCNCSCGTCKSFRSSRTWTQTSRCPGVVNYAVGKRRQRGQRLLNFNYFDNFDPEFCRRQLDQIQNFLYCYLKNRPTTHRLEFVLERLESDLLDQRSVHARWVHRANLGIGQSDYLSETWWDCSFVFIVDPTLNMIIE